MNVCVALEYRFERLPDGSVWTKNQYAWSFWRRYLDVFEEVRCLARVRDVTRLPGEWCRADGPAVTFEAVPYYLGLTQFLKRAHAVRRAVRAAIRPADAVVLRAPGNVSDLAWDKLKVVGQPYAVEVLGDPYDVFAPGAVRHPLRAVLRWRATRQLERQCAGACAASYVTAAVLQRRYPSRGPTTAASSIDLRDEMFVSKPRVFIAGAAHLIFVGSLEQYYKAPDLLLRAFADALARGLNLRLTVVGEGRCRAALEALAGDLGCRDRILFAGQVPSAQIVTALDAADIFVLPSKTEGLPRAMVEAMARGLPCLGTTAGGIPELLAADAIVPIGNVRALADRIVEVARDPAWLTRMSARNLETAKTFRSAALQQLRVGFYRQLRAATEAWLRETGPTPGRRGVT